MMFVEWNTCIDNDGPCVKIGSGYRQQKFFSTSHLQTSKIFLHTAADNDTSTFNFLSALHVTHYHYYQQDILTQI